jgi:monoamine oxidase
MRNKNTNMNVVMKMIPIPLDYKVSSWCRDPFSLGGWSSLTPAATEETRRLLQQPFGCASHDDDDVPNPMIFLCGEHTNPTQAAMVHGAYQEGIRVAQTILQNLRTKNNHNHKEEEEEVYKVLIVGAGAAGLACAWQLLHPPADHHDHDDDRVDCRRKIHVTVVEARDRMGGRVRTVDMNLDHDDSNSAKMARVELGANWLQQGNANSLYHIAKDTLHLETVDTDFMCPDEYPLHRKILPERVEEIMKEFAQRSNHQTGRYKKDACSKSATTTNQQQPQQQSIQNILDDWFQEIDNYSDNDNPSSSSTTTTRFTREEIQHVLEGELMIDTGVELSKLSSQFGMEPGVGQGDRWLVGGYQQVLDYLAQNVMEDIHFQWAVNRIDYSGLSSALHPYPHPKVSVTAQRQQQQQQHEPTRNIVNNNNNNNNDIHDDAIQGDNNKADQEDVTQKTWIVDAVVCTIPSAVLQRKPPQLGAIEFLPPLPNDHQNAIHALVTGQVEKVVLRFQERWWPPAIQSNGYLRVYGSDHNNNNNNNSFGNVSEWLDCTDTFGVPVITGIFTGPWLNDIWSEGSTDQQVALKATEALYKAIHNNNNNNNNNAPATTQVPNNSC